MWADLFPELHREILVRVPYVDTRRKARNVCHAWRNIYKALMAPRSAAAWWEHLAPMEVITNLPTGCFSTSLHFPTGEPASVFLPCVAVETLIAPSWCAMNVFMCIKHTHDDWENLFTLSAGLTPPVEQRESRPVNTDTSLAVLPECIQDTHIVDYTFHEHQIQAVIHSDDDDDPDPIYKFDIGEADDGRCTLDATLAQVSHLFRAVADGSKPLSERRRRPCSVAVDDAVHRFMTQHAIDAFRLLLAPAGHITKEVITALVEEEKKKKKEEDISS